jgi:glutathione S-transferase
VDLELVSFKVCPYVQRAVITLVHRQIPHTITFIDLADPPQWFAQISPFGKVPLLRVDHNTVLFESAVINEFLDEISGAEMQPDGPLARALNRAWVEYGSACLGDLHELMTVATAAGFEAMRAALRGKLDRLEAVLGEGPCFNGARLCLVDTAFAPLFMRLELLREAAPVYHGGNCPRVAAWSAALLALPAVQRSVVEDFPAQFRQYVLGKGGHLAALLG